MSVRDLAEEVETALGALAKAEGDRAASLECLRLADEDVARATARVAAARDRLLAAFPNLDGTPKMTSTPNDGNDGNDVVEIDDADDPRYTAGATLSTNDDDPLPPIEFTEHEEA